MGKKGEPKDPVALSVHVRELLGPIDPEFLAEEPGGSGLIGEGNPKADPGEGGGVRQEAPAEAAGGLGVHPASGRVNQETRRRKEVPMWFLWWVAGFGCGLVVCELYHMERRRP
jgi:hypothetical protein